MKYSLRWLQDYVEPSVPVAELLERLTMSGSEVEGFETHGIESPHVVVGQIVSSVQHPNADRLRVCQVNDGQGIRQIVCGAKNYKDGDKAPLALPGAKLPGDFTIKESKLRGELSQGMLCSSTELGLPAGADGLLILPEDAPVGQLFHEYWPVDTLFDVEITPNRPDLLSYLGLARELTAIGIGARKNAAATALHLPSEKGVWGVEVESDSCPYYSATQLSGVKVGPSPMWLRKKIEAMGHRAINNVVDITNFVLWETGQPLHAFDAAKLSGHAITVRNARAAEPFAALDSKSYTLTADDLVITDASGPVALAGVMGGQHSGVTTTTTDVILEAAWFEPNSVRRTSRRLGLLSDSSYRYERRVDPAGVVPARDRAIQLLIDLTGAKVVAAPAVKAFPTGANPVREISLRLARVGKVLGVHIGQSQVDAWLTSLGLEKICEGDVSKWRAPSFRHDLEREIDLIEEIARLHGLGGIPSTLHHGLNRESQADREHDRLSRLRRTLAARGWHECLTDALVDRASAAGTAEAVELANPLNEQYTHLRPKLKQSLLAAAGRNLARGVKGVRLFEVGRVYLWSGAEGEKSVTEPVRLGLLIAGEASDPAWYQAERNADLHDPQGVLDLLGERAGLKIEGGAIHAQQVPPSELKAHGLKAAVYYAEVDLDAYLSARPAPAVYQPVPAFPAVRRDLAVVVPEATAQEQVASLIRGSGVAALQEISLFDVFADPKGERIPAGQKSLAYSLIYRAADRTLTEKEVTTWQEEIRGKLKTALSCTFRDT